MTGGEDFSADIGADVPEAERAELMLIAERLVRERPVPRAAFRGDLGRRLTGTRPSVSRPSRLGLRIASYSAGGLALLLLAAVGVAGVGPFAA